MAHCSKLILVLLLISVAADAQETDTQTCADLMRQALRRHYAPADSGKAVRRRMTITAVEWTAARPDTTVAEIETIEGGELNVMRSDSVERWSDYRSMILIDRRTKTIRVIDLAARGGVVTAQQTVRDAFRDSLVDRARSIQCDDIPDSHGKAIRARLVLEGDMQRFHNASAITADLNERGEIVRFAITHPPGSAIRSTTYVVQESDRSYAVIDVSRPVAEHFFDADGTLRPEYAGYAVVHEK